MGKGSCIRIPAWCVLAVLLWALFPVPAAGYHSADTTADFTISISELLRVIQFYNSGAYHCEAGTEDGFGPGAGGEACVFHDSDYRVQDWAISLSELLRLIQFYNSGGYRVLDGGEDGYGAGADGLEWPEGAIQDWFGKLGALVAGAASEGLDPADVSALGDVRGAAETAYAGGDPCGAAGHLDTFASLAQALRTGAAVGVAERLYNEGRMLRYLLLTTSAVRPCPGQDRVGLEADVAQNTEQSSNQQNRMLAVFGEPRLLTATAEGQTFTELFVPGATGQMAPGKPGVPMMRRRIAVPPGAELGVTADATPAEVLYANLYPAQNPPVEPLAAGAPAKNISELAPVFEMDAAAYEVDALYPPELVSVTRLGACRGLRVYAVEVAAGQYNPVSDQLTLYDRIDVTVNFNTPADAVFASAKLQNPFERADLCLAGLLNADIVTENLEPWTPPLDIDFGEELLILTHPDFKLQADELALWKNEHGILTTVMEVGTGTDRPTAESIEALIDERFENNLIRPSYVMLVGDAEFIPPFYVNYNYPDVEGVIATDWPYGNVAAAFFDIFPDIAVGRIPVDNATQAAWAFEKVTRYTDSPPEMAAFYENALLAAQFQCCRKDITTQGVNQMRFTEPSEFAWTVLNNRGYSIDRIYVETVDGGCAGCDPPRAPYTGDTRPRYHYDLLPVPGAIGPYSGFAWGGGTDDIIDALNEGRFLAIHNDHGAVDGWGHPSLRMWELGPLNNWNPLLPVIFSMNCSSGYFDNEIVDPPNAGTEYFSEWMVRRNQFGAIGIIAATRMSWTYANATFCMGFTDAIWPEAIPSFDNEPTRRLGDILMHGQLYLMSQLNTHDWLGPEDIGDEIHMYHLFGDPTVEMWTRQPVFIDLPDDPAVSIGDLLTIPLAGFDGAEVTVLRIDPLDDPMPVARGIVEQDAAALEPLTEVGAGDTLQISVRLENGVGDSVQVVLQ